MYLDHHKIDDTLWTGLRMHFGEDEVLELSWVIVEFIALGKIIKVMDLPFGTGAAAPGGEEPGR